MEILKKFENNKTKITVEQISEFKFISTTWDKNSEYEVDRKVFEFETFGGAMDKAWEFLMEKSEHGAPLILEERKIYED